MTRSYFDFIPSCITGKDTGKPTSTILYFFFATKAATLTVAGVAVAHDALAS